MSTARSKPVPADRPSPVAIARALCALPVAAGDLPNYERSCLKDAHKFLEMDPPDVDKARAELLDGLAHAFRSGWREERPEAWLVAACVELLR